MRKLHISLVYCFKVFILSILPMSAYAHTGGEALVSMFSGFSHPFLGIDHILVMIAVGMWSVISGGYRLWLFPLLFMLAMLVGAMLNFSGMEMNGIESWVAFSVLALGCIVRQNREIPTIFASGLVIVFALGHGYVHAAEIGSDTSVNSYAMGFLIATALLQGTGMAIGVFGPVVLKKIKNIFGLICALTGIVMLAGI